MSFLSDLKEATAREYGVGQEENRLAMIEARKSVDKSPEAPRMRQMAGSYRTPQALKASLNLPLNPAYDVGRSEAGVPFDVSSAGKRVGTALGALGADLTQDSFRRFYWLLNAAQATGDIISEEAIARARPDLYDQLPAEKIKTPGGQTRTKRRPKYGGPGAIQALSIPAGIDKATGLGLMTPFGGYEGYEAVMPSENDPSKTSNVVGEIASKYILGRTGNLLDWDEFKKVRPDVSKGEYNAYKAFKYDKKTDLNPFDDGQMTLPTGIIKTSDDGIHGAEVQFLGRSLPVNTALIPFAGAVAGGMAGVARRPDAKCRDRSAVKRGLIGSALGTVAGMTAGNLLEGERRRRNEASNQAYYDQL